MQGRLIRLWKTYEMGLAYIYGAYSLASKPDRVKRILQWMMRDRVNLSANIWY